MKHLIYILSIFLLSTTAQAMEIIPEKITEIETKNEPKRTSLSVTKKENELIATKLQEWKKKRSSLILKESNTEHKRVSLFLTEEETEIITKKLSRWTEKEQKDESKRMSLFVSPDEKELLTNKLVEWQLKKKRQKGQKNLQQEAWQRHDLFLKTIEYGLITIKKYDFSIQQIENLLGAPQAKAHELLPENYYQSGLAVYNKNERIHQLKDDFYKLLHNETKNKEIFALNSQEQSDIIKKIATAMVNSSSTQQRANFLEVKRLLKQKEHPGCLACLLPYWCLDPEYCLANCGLFCCWQQEE